MSGGESLVWLNERVVVAAGIGGTYELQVDKLSEVMQIRAKVVAKESWLKRARTLAAADVRRRIGPAKDLP